MLAVSAYSKEHIKACRARVDAMLASFRALSAGAGSGAVTAFEPHCFGFAVLALDNMFVHRLRGAEGKDGNPLNEVRMLAASLVEADGILLADKTTKYDPAKSVLGCKIGDPIVVTAEGFAKLAATFFDEIARKYPQKAKAK